VFRPSVAVRLWHITSVRAGVEWILPISDEGLKECEQSQRSMHARNIWTTTTYHLASVLTYLRSILTASYTTDILFVFLQITTDRSLRTKRHPIRTTRIRRVHTIILTTSAVRRATRPSTTSSGICAGTTISWKEWVISHEVRCFDRCYEGTTWAWNTALPFMV